MLYVFVQRSLGRRAPQCWRKRGSSTPATPDGEDPAAWTRSPTSDEGLSTESAFHRGVYRERRSAAGRQSSRGRRRRRCWPTSAWPSCFEGLNFARVDDQAGSLGSLIQEIWRVFLVAMMVAMVVEAALCLPKVAHGPGGTRMNTRAHR